MDKLIKAQNWVFDLDNTLYPAKSDLFAQIQVKMNDYVAKFLDLPHDEARLVQKKYYVEYGTTLNGLMKHHNVDPHDYLHHVHDIDYSILQKDNELKAAIESINGRKIVFTNGSKKHAQNAINALGLDGAFDTIIDIAATNFVPKPNFDAFKVLVEKQNINPNHSVMVEDLPKNLKTAKDMGFATILVWSDKEWHDEPKGHAPAGESDLEHEFIDYSTNNLGDFLSNIVIAQRAAQDK